jgi:hypothetical protein
MAFLPFSHARNSRCGPLLGITALHLLSFGYGAHGSRGCGLQFFLQKKTAATSCCPARAALINY